MSYLEIGRTKSQVEQSRGRMERVGEILGKDYLGLEALRKAEDILREKSGINLEFHVDERNLPTLPYGERDLQIARGKGEVCTIRTDRMSTQNISERQITLDLLRDLFGKIKDPHGKKNFCFV